MHGVSNVAPNTENRGFINNPAFIETQNGLILIDPGGSYEIGMQVLAQIRRVTLKPVLAIFNTHDHADHWFANVVFKEVFPDVKIYAHSQMKASALELYGGQYRSRGFVFEAGREVVFADHFLEDGDIVTIDGEKLHILHPPSAHTNSDISISHLNSNTIFMGDLLMSNTLANFGLHSSIQGNIRFLEKIRDENTYTFYIPGHGPSGGKEDVLMPYLTYLSIIEDEVKKAYAQDVTGSGLEALKEKIILRLGWEELPFSLGFVERYMYHIYGELEVDRLF
jgi:glyoxylase-like metal-dependent hydrolase (beta-lactamase superfamily II)